MSFSTLEQFLLDNIPEEEYTYEFKSGRLKGQKFKLSLMSSKEFTRYQKEATKKVKKETRYDGYIFNTQIVLNHCIDPNFKSADLLKKAGFLVPEDFLNNRLKAGEVDELAEAILEISGFGDGEEGLLEEAKNS